MAKLGINTGTTANDGTGDTLREAGGKINTNFDEIYSSLGDGTSIFSGIVTSIIGGDFVSVSSPTGEVTITGLANTENINSESLIVVGVSTLGVVTSTQSMGIGTIYTPRVECAGAVIGGTLVGDGSQITGLATTERVSTDSLVVSGISTLGIVTGITEIQATNVYATHISGDGSHISNITYASVSGIATYATTSGVATDATYAGYSVTSGIATYSSSSGISTYSSLSGIATYSTTAGVATDATYAGYSVTSGIATYAPSSGLSTFSGYATSAGISTDSIFAGYASTAGFATCADYAKDSGISTTSGYATSAGIATYAPSSGLSTFSGYATSSGISTNATYSTYSSISGIATYATTSGVATDATYAGYSVTSGVSTYSGTSGIATYASSSGISTLATNAQGITGIPNIQVAKLDADDVEANGIVITGISTLGIVTGATYYGDGTNLTGVIPTRPVQVFQNLEVLGVSTLGVVTSVQSLSANTIYASDVVATNVSGDGSGLTNVTASASVGMKLDDVYVGSGFTTLDFRYQGQLEAEFAGLGNTAVFTITGLAATDNTRSDSLVVTGVSTLGVVTSVDSIGVTDIYADSITSSNIIGITTSSNKVLAVTDTSSLTGRRVSFIDDSDVGVSDYETVNVGNLIWTPFSGVLSGVTTYSGQDIGVSGTVTSSEFHGVYYGDGSNISGIVTNIVAGQNVTISGSNGSVTINSVSIGPSEDITTTGDITAASFTGDGSALTGIVASGSGVIVQDDSSVVGTAGTINFGDNLSVSALSNGAVTITGVGTFSGDYNDLSNAPTVPTNNNQLTNGAGFITTSFTSTSQLTNDVGFVTTGATVSLAEGLTGSPDISVGIASASTVSATTIVSDNFVGNGSGLIDGRWTLGANGSTEYTFTGIGFTVTTSNPDIYLARGRSYEFVNNMNLHPFQIQDTPNGTIGVGYSNGVTNNGVVNGTLFIQVPFNTPDTLYYQCASHTGMGGTIFIYPTLR